MSSIRYAKSSTGEMLYCIRIPDKGKHELAKSYDQFCALYKRLGERIPQSILPPLPPSGFSLFNSAKFHTQRAASLQTCMDRLYSMGEVRTYPDFIEFAELTINNNNNSNTSKDSMKKSVQDLISNTELAMINIPSLPHDKVPQMKELSIDTITGTANKTLLQLNALYTKLRTASSASTALKQLSDAGFSTGFERKISLLSNMTHDIVEPLVADSVKDPDLQTYLKSLAAALNDGKRFIESLDILNSLLQVQKMEEKAKKVNPNAKIADGYAPWYSAQADRLIPLLFSDDVKTSGAALEFLRAIEAATAKDAQISRELGDGTTSALLEGIHMEISRSVQCLTGSDGSGSGGGSYGNDDVIGKQKNKNSELYFRGKVQTFEAEMFELISKADSVNDAEKQSDRESATVRYRALILRMMRDLRLLRMEMTKAISEIESAGEMDDERKRLKCSLEHISERVEELQQNIGDFEEAWSRTVDEKPSRESKMRDEQVSIVQERTLALEDDLYEL